MADQVGATFGLLVQDVIDAFPAVEGLVVSVDGDRVYLGPHRQGRRPAGAGVHRSSARATCSAIP